MEKDKITAEAEQTAIELSKRENAQVHAYVVDLSDDKFAVCFVKEPSRIIKMRAMDKIMEGQQSKAGDIIMEACLLPETDSRIKTDDKLYMTMLLNCVNLVVCYTNVIKKN